MSMLKQIAGNLAFEDLDDDDKLALEAIPPGAGRIDIFAEWEASQEELNAAALTPLYRLIETVHLLASNAVATAIFDDTTARVRFHIGANAVEIDGFDRCGRRANSKRFDPFDEAARVVGKITEA